MGNFHHRALMVFASVSAYTAPALMIVCLLTDYWIYGKQTRLSPNPTVKVGDTRVLNFTYHRIGLWKECAREATDQPYLCEIVKYSKTEAKLEKGFKAVAYRSAPSMACFTAASALLIVAIFLFTRGLCKRRRKAVFFISGLLFSISGLLTMVGVTLYVSITTEESVKIDQDLPVMKCFYGYSFLCAVLSFVLQELTGVLTVYWFIYRFQALVRKQQKLRDRTRQLMGTCLSMTTALPMNLAALAPPSKALSSSSNHRSQNHSTTLGQVKSDSSFVYGDYCRVLIRVEDMHLLSQMVKSKSQGQLLGNVKSTKLVVNSQPARAMIAENHKSRRQSTRRSGGVKRTTSV